MWDSGIEIGEEQMKATANLDSKFSNFFLKAKEVQRNLRNATDGATNGADPADQSLLLALEKAKALVDAALSDSFNTPDAMQALSNLVTDFNSTEKASPSATLEIAQYLTRMVRIFGLDPENKLDSNKIGWSGIVS